MVVGRVYIQDNINIFEWVGEEKRGECRWPAKSCTPAQAARFVQRIAYLLLQRCEQAYVCSSVRGFRYLVVPVAWGVAECERYGCMKPPPVSTPTLVVTSLLVRAMFDVSIAFLSFRGGIRRTHSGRTTPPSSGFRSRWAASRPSRRLTTTAWPSPSRRRCVLYLECVVEHARRYFVCPRLCRNV